jgi:hypothetical protein
MDDCSGNLNLKTLSALHHSLTPTNLNEYLFFLEHEVTEFEELPPKAKARTKAKRDLANLGEEEEEEEAAAAAGEEAAAA